MNDSMGAQISLNIDESKIHVITRAQRLRPRVVAWLKEAQKQAGAAAPPDLAEAIVWLEEMET